MKECQNYFLPDNQSAFVIAEVGQNHDGSLGQAHAFIDAVASTGANAIKFQTHIADQESTPGEPFRVKFSYEDANRYDYWKRMEFTEEQWAELANHAKEKGLYFLSSPFSISAVLLLERIGVELWKVASGEVNNHIQLRKMAETGLPVLLSSGMSTWNELEESVDLLKRYDTDVGVFQATSMYPCPPEFIGLNVIPQIKQKLGVNSGLSDHSGTIYPCLGAYTLGARFFEVHVTMSKWMFGPDISSSLTIEELKSLVSGLRQLEKIMGHEVNKDDVADRLSEMRALFTKSIVTTGALKKGTVLKAEHLTVKKPGSGTPSSKIELFFGKRLRADVEKNYFLKPTDIEQES